MKKHRSGQRIYWFLIFVFLFLVVGILITGYLFYTKQQERIKAGAQKNLAAIADLKVMQITQWRQERLSDGEVVFDNESFARQVETYFKNPARIELKKDILKLMESIQARCGYKFLFLLDIKGVVHLSVPPYSGAVNSHMQTYLNEALRDQKVVFSDLHKSEVAPFVHIDLIVPLLSPNRKERIVIGALLLRIDPEKILFPLIQTWPTPSRTSETLLFEQEGDSVVYLNELRHRKNTTLKLRFPISNEQLPASMAVRGKEGIVEGIDYRGVPVLAAIRRIPNSPWYMNAKVDQQEIYAPLRSQAWIVGSVMFLLILATASIIGFWWRHQRARFYRERYMDELERQALVKHFDYAIKYANDIILLINMDGRIIEANDQACKAYGYARMELSQLYIHDIRSERTRAEVDEQMKQVAELGGLVFETEHLRKDGTVFPVEVSSRIITIENVSFYQSIIRDITERKRNEQTLKAAKEYAENLIETANTIVVGLDTQGNITGFNQAAERITGYTRAELENRNWFEVLAPRDRYPEVWKEFQRLMAGGLPKRFENPILTKTGEERYIVWSNNEVYENGHISGTVSFGLDITDRIGTEQQIRIANERLQHLLSSTSAVIYTSKTQEDYGATFISENVSSMVGFEQTDFLETSNFWVDHIHPDDVLRVLDELPHVFETGRYSDEYRFQHKNGKYIWIRDEMKVVRDSGGKPLEIVGLWLDITERKQAEEAQLESEETAQALMNAPKEAAYLLDTNRRIIALNEAGATRFGKSVSDLIGACIDDLFPPEIAESRRLFFDKLIRSPQAIYFEDEYAGKYLENSYYPIYDSHGMVSRIAVFSRDVTERRRAEKALKQSETLFKMLVESSPVAIAVFSGPSKKLEYVTSRFTELFGYEHEDLSSMEAWWPLAYPVEEYRNQIEIKWRDIIGKAQREGIEMEPMESVITCKDGTTKYVESMFTSIGEQTLMFFSDLTQRRITEEALRQTHTFNDLLIQTMPFGIDIVDEEGRILFMSKAMRNMLGSDATNTCCWEAYKDDKKQCVDCPLRKGITFGKQEIMETTGVFGGKIYQISHVGIMYEGQKAMLEVFQDITEQKKLQQELIQSQKLLSIGTMAGGIAHDFNNILAIILGYSSILISVKDNPQRFSDGVTAIRQAVDRGAGLVRQILTFARKTDISFQPLSIPDLLKELVSMLQQTFPRIITFNTTIDKNLPYINADHTQMHQALLNLCVNARDAMPNGGEISIKAMPVTGEKLREHFPSADNRWYIDLNVSDTGIGIDENVRNQIFDPFFTTKEKGKGTGLGLSVVYGIVQAHRGFVNVESSIGHGTMFQLYFPVPQESSAALETEEQVQEQVSGGNEILLFVEDETLLLDMVQILLESNGYSVLTAKDGEEAVDVYSKHKHEVALVISDMGLPKLTGLTEFEKLKEINPAVKIIFASGYFEPEMKSTLEKAGARGFLQKPYVTDDILMKIRKVLDTK